MARPTEQELQEALELARRMREQGQDPHFLAKSLLNHHYRLGYLEEVLHAVERYLRSGMAEEEHRQLLKTLAKVRAAEARTAKESPDELGLG